MIPKENYIGCELSAKGNNTYQTLNPKTDKPSSWTLVEATEKEVDAAAQKAAKAFVMYKKVSGADKAGFLEAIAVRLEKNKEELVKTYIQESGLPEGRANGELGRTTGQLRAFAALVKEGSWVEATIDKGNLQRQPVPKPDLRKMKVPIGPIAVFGASNFPFAFSTAGGDTASALASGCPVVVKSHPMHAGTSALVAAAIIAAAKETGMPDGVFSHLNSKGTEVGGILVKHPAIKGVGFTGSFKGGIALQKMAAEREEPIPVFAEMGSINPVVILPKAVKHQKIHWAKAYAGSIVLGAGQFCTNPGLILGLTGADFDAFAKALAEELKPMEPATMLHTNIAKAYATGAKTISESENVETLISPKNEENNRGSQALVKVNGADFVKNRDLHNEVFGPFSMLVACADTEELTQVLKNLEGQLTGSLLAAQDEEEEYPEIIDALSSRVGRMLFNGVPTGVEVSPAMQHGGPFPASTDSRFTAVGTHAIQRWVRPFSYQDWPQELLPEELRDGNPLEIDRFEV